MTRKKRARPPYDGTPPVGLVGWEEFVLPFTLEPAAGVANRVREYRHASLHIQETGLEEMLHHQPYGEHNLQIVRGVERILVVRHMAGVEMLEVEPAEEGKDPHKYIMKNLSSEDTLVHQFMYCINGEGANGSMQKHYQENDPPRPAMLAIQC